MRKTSTHGAVTLNTKAPVENSVLNPSSQGLGNTKSVTPADLEMLFFLPHVGPKQQQQDASFYYDLSSTISYGKVTTVNLQLGVSKPL